MMRKSAWYIGGLWLFLLLAWLFHAYEGTGGLPLVILWANDPEDYDPQHTSHPIAYEVFRHVCEPLFYVDEHGHLRGILAEDDVRYSDDGRRITIVLRPGITFHDGAPLDAESVQVSFARLQALGKSPLSNDLRDVKVVAHHDGRSVSFTLPYPNYEFARLTLSSAYASIVSFAQEEWRAPGFVACTGPYQFAPSLYTPGHKLTLVPNPHYHGRPPHTGEGGAPKIHRLTFRFEAERETRLALLAQGDACVLSLSQEQIDRLATQPRFKLYTASGGLTYLGFNFQRTRWQEPHVRQAIVQAIDKTALAAQGPFWVAHTPLTPNTLGYDASVADFSYLYAPENSRALLHKSNFDFESEMTLLIPESVTYRELAAAIQEQLSHIGLRNIRIREIPRAELLSRRQDFDLLLFDYAWGDYTALSIFLGPGPRNLLNYPHDDIYTRVMRARATEDESQRQYLIAEAQKIVLQKAILQPLLIRQITFAVDSACVSGERQAPSGELIFWEAETTVPGRFSKEP